MLSFDAGDGADKLIVAVSGEGGSVASLTYNGAAMTPAIVGGGRAKAIYYLDNPYTGGSADISLTLSGGLNNGIRMGAVSVAGTAVGADVTTSAAATNISITATTPNSFVFSVYGGNDDGVASAESPLTAIYGGTTGNAKGAAGYENAVGVGANSYTFTDDRVPPLDPASLAAAFKPRTPGGTIFRFR